MVGPTLLPAPAVWQRSLDYCFESFAPAPPGQAIREAFFALRRARYIRAVLTVRPILVSPRAR
jgi:hypothetical protein